MIKLESGSMGLWQWNTNQRIITDYPEGTVFSFSIGTAGTLDRTVYGLGMNYHMVDIPNVLLQKAGILCVCVHVVEGGGITTTLENRFLVRPQRKPENYVNNENDALLWHQLDERVAKIEQSGPNIEKDQELIEVVEVTPETAGMKLIRKHEDLDGQRYNFRSVTLCMKFPRIPPETMRADVLDVKVHWSDGHTHWMSYSLKNKWDKEDTPIEAELRNSAYSYVLFLECRNGIKTGHQSRTRYGEVTDKTAACPVEVSHGQATVTRIELTATGGGFEAGDIVEIWGTKA